MKHYHFDELSGSDRIITAKQKNYTPPLGYEIEELQYPHIHIRNRGLAHFLAFSDNQSKEVKEVRDAVNDYTEYVRKLKKIPGFIEYFKQHGCCITRKEVTEKWSEDIANEVFSLKSYCFTTELNIINQYLFDYTICVNYEAQIGENDIELPIGRWAEAYPDEINGKKAIWNWVDNGHDFCFSIWQLLGEREQQNKEIKKELEEADIDENEVNYNFDIYDQTRYEYVEPQLINIFRKLESLGYLEAYTLKAEWEDPRWVDFGKTDGTIDLALIDLSFLKNKLLMEQIELLLWQPSDQIPAEQYFLTDREGEQYLSTQKGTLVGHHKLKIYGRLDCPSANRFVAKGQYIQHRVFFDQEETAIAAGYRPCGICMPEAYKRWKSSQTKDKKSANE